MQQTLRVPSIINRPRLNKEGVVRLGVWVAGDAREVDHFILDIEDKTLAKKAAALYGAKPKTLNITFYTDSIEDCFRSTLQRWGKSKKGTPYLLCEGNGLSAIANNKTLSCPCAALGGECRKTTLLKFLIPDISMAGYFLLATKSNYNPEGIETSLKLVYKATGGLIMRRFQLRRTEGYANIKGFGRVKKYFVSLTPLEDETVVVSPVPRLKSEASKDSIIPSMAEILTTPLFEDEDGLMTAYRLEQQLARGRDKVKEKIKLLIMHPGVDAALELYACKLFNKPSFQDLSVEELRKLWHEIGRNPDVAAGVFALAKQQAKVSHP